MLPQSHCRTLVQLNSRQTKAFKESAIEFSSHLKNWKLPGTASLHNLEFHRHKQLLNNCCCFGLPTSSLP